MKSSLNLDFSIDGPLKSLIEPEPLPESFEDATKEELSDILKAFRKRAKDEAEAKKENVSTDFWFAVYFANQNQRDAFLRAVDLIGKMEDQYIAGDVFAKAVGVEIPTAEINTPKSFRRPANIDDLILEI